VDEIIAFFRAVMKKDVAKLAEYGLDVNDIGLNYQMDAARRLADVQLTQQLHGDRELKVVFDLED
jgi:hypothetical protein